MPVLADSRFNYSVVMRVLDAEGEAAENERVDLPYPRPAIMQSDLPDLQDYTVRDGDTWSNIASRFLRGRSDLWWVIAEFSGVIDPFTELTTGSVVKIPQFDTVMFDVLRFS